MIINNQLANSQMAKVQTVNNYLNGSHKVLSRKDFKFTDGTLTTAKIVLQSIGSIVDFHAGLLCGTPVSITGDTEKLKLIQTIYKKGFFSVAELKIARNLYKFGNAYEYIYRKNGKILSKVIENSDAYPIYNDNGEYVQFEERWINQLDNVEHEIIYTDTDVTTYVNGVKTDTYKNTTGLPIHYTNIDTDATNIFGISLVGKLVPIMDEIEELLSKAMDSVTALSLNPLGVSIGDRVQGSIDTDAVGACVNIESGGDYKWATASLDTESIKLLLDNLLNQFYAVACVPSTVMGQSNIANVSETSISIIYNQAMSMAKRTAMGMQLGIAQRLEYIGMLSSDNYEDVNISFNMSRPVDNSSLMNDLKSQWEMGAISRETIIKCSPYTTDTDRELMLIDNDNDYQNKHKTIVDNVDNVDNSKLD